MKVVGAIVVSRLYCEYIQGMDETPIEGECQGRSSSTVDIRARCLHGQILIWVPPLKLLVSSIHVFETEVPGYGLWSWGPMVQRTPTGTMKDADSGGVAVIKIAHEIPKGPAPKHEEKS